MTKAHEGTLPVGFVASADSLCNELELAAEYCASTGQQLVVSDDRAVLLARDLARRIPGLRVRADPGAWRHGDATANVPLADVDNLFGVAGWYEQHFPVDGPVEGYTPSMFLRAADRAARQSLLEQTTELPSNITTRIAIEAAVLEVAHRQQFLDDLAPYRGRRFAFLFADKRDPIATYQRVEGLRLVLQQHTGSEVDHIDPLIAADALASGARWVGVGASSARRMPRRPGDSGGGPIAAGYLPGLFLAELLELRSPTIYANWFGNSPSPFCPTCGRRLDLFEPSVTDKAVIVKHNLHQTTTHIADLVATSPRERGVYLREVRLAALARHLSLDPLADIRLNSVLKTLLEIDDPQMRALSSTGTWT